MSSSAEKILYRKAALIFEELGFLMPQADRGQEPQTYSSGACVHYDGPFKGCLLALLSPQVLSVLSSNMLGNDDSSDESVEHDALREMANVICGNSLPAIFGDKEPFRLSSPEVFSDLDALPIDSDYTRVAQICVPFDCGQADIILYAESRAAALLNADQKPS
jgi:hypothetical protein